MGALEDLAINSLIKRVEHLEEKLDKTGQALKHIENGDLCIKDNHGNGYIAGQAISNMYSDIEKAKSRLHEFNDKFEELKRLVSALIGFSKSV